MKTGGANPAEMCANRETFHGEGQLANTISQRTQCSLQQAVNVPQSKQSKRTQVLNGGNEGKGFDVERTT